MKENISVTGTTGRNLYPSLKTARPSRAAALAVLVLGLCAPAFSMGKPQPTVVRDLVYSSPNGIPLKLDLYLPADSGKEKRPAVIWVHGGAWNSGSKKNGGRVAPMVGKGFVVVDINYRLSGKAPFPAQIIDCKAAVRWLRAHADKYRIDPERIGMAGLSAGGHLAALTGTTGKVAEFEKGGHLDYSSSVQAVCALSPPTDIAALESKASQKDLATIARLVGGDPKNEPYRSLLLKANPIRYVSQDDPPFLIVAGTHDRTVPYSQSTKLYEALKKAGTKPEVFYVKEGNHLLEKGTNASRTRINQMMAKFFDENLK